ncbi:hypothetical protein K470DRAFT_277842 [Piedraia hortae CBS 480.64]|uniref:UBL3-like ubiquitin domain-containing protein n=1 Tax=Piedraia hortae CBS 480.64 TaxID=1314780 RepID=A0A6A7BWA2_9PEZI|nr:hypothetical protein K470DRAFT_277842 [Piedraia hortae CBS 480.64]
MEMQPIKPPDEAAEKTLAQDLRITLLLSTGAKHEFTLQQSTSTQTPASATGDEDPRTIKGYRLKEMLFREWKEEEWGVAKPISPAEIRLITMGHLIDDNRALIEYGISFNKPNVVHITVKPPDFGDAGNENPKKNRKASMGGTTAERQSSRDNERERGGGCCGCVIL